MAGPGDETAAGAAGHGRMRASHADREQAIEALKVAFVDGRLTKDELDTRAGGALSAQTHADLAALTADIPPIPAVPAVSRSARLPVPARRRPLVRAAVGSGSCLGFAAAAVWAAFLLDPGPLASAGPPGVISPGLMLVLAAWAVLAALCFVGYGVDASMKQRRSRGPLPPQPGPGGHAPSAGQRGADIGPVSPDPQPDRTRTDLRPHRPGRDQRYHRSGPGTRAPHGTRLVPGAV